MTNLKTKSNCANLSIVRLTSACVFLAFMICGAGTQIGKAATFVVNSTADAQDAAPGNGVCETAANNRVCTLRAAITEANALAGADIITLRAGNYTQTLNGADDENQGGDFDVNSDITINGAGAGSTFIQAAASAGTAVERVIHFVPASTATMVLNGVTVRYGRYADNTSGGGVRVEAAAIVAINNTIVRDNSSAGRGGGVFVASPTADLTMNNCQIVNNTSGGANSTSIGGAGFYQAAGTATLNNVNLANNQSINNSVVTPLPAAFGGGATVAGGILNLNNSSIVNNTATTSVAADAFGGGIAISDGTVNLNNSSVSNNKTTTTGAGAAISGGIDNQLAAVNLTNSIVSGNTAASAVGGIRSISAGRAATVAINQSAVLNNSSPNVGGVLNIAAGTANATTTINNSTIGANSTASDGGGVINYTLAAGDAVTNINFSTVAGNKADADNNATGDGGGAANFGQITSGQSGTGTITLQSSIIADNTSGGRLSPDIYGSIASLGYNHVENTTGGIFAQTTGDSIGSDPGLGALDLNGGTTPNYLPSSPSVVNAIPAGAGGCGNAPFNVDQKNAVRPFNSGCEKGASELSFVIVTPSDLPNGRENQFYNQTLTTAFGTGASAFALTSGTLPANLTLNANGTISGTIALGTSRTYTFTVQATDSNPFAPSKTDQSRLFAPNVTQKTFRLTITAPTAAAASVGGRVATADNRGLRNARVTMTGANGEVRTTVTGAFGYYRFADVPAGGDYVFTVSSKHYTFAEPSQARNIVGDTEDINFTANK